MCSPYSIRIKLPAILGHFIKTRFVWESVFVGGCKRCVLCMYLSLHFNSSRINESIR